MAAATSGTPAGDSTDDDRALEERGDECGVDGHLDLTKAAAEQPEASISNLIYVCIILVHKVYVYVNEVFL